MKEVTPEEVRAAKMTGILHLDGDDYMNQYRCVQFPELTRVDTGPKRGTGGQHVTRFFIGGEPTDARGATDIARALNAYRAGVAAAQAAPSPADQPGTAHPPGSVDRRGPDPSP